MNGWCFSAPLSAPIDCDQPSANIARSFQCAKTWWRGDGGGSVLYITLQKKYSTKSVVDEDDDDGDDDEWYKSEHHVKPEHDRQPTVPLSSLWYQLAPSSARLLCAYAKRHRPKIKRSAIQTGTVQLSTPPVKASRLAPKPVPKAEYRRVLLAERHLKCNTIKKRGGAGSLYRPRGALRKR